MSPSSALPAQQRGEILDAQASNYKAQIYTTELEIERLKSLPDELQDPGVEGQIEANQRQLDVLQHSLKFVEGEKSGLPKASGGK